MSKTPTVCFAESLNAAADNQNRVHKQTGADFCYDAAGNMTFDPVTGNSYSFDPENRITGAGGYTYTYDADGNRVEKSNGTTGTIYWYTTLGIVAESDLSGNLTSEYVFFNGDRIARKDFPGNNVSYYFSDHLKTASVITDGAGNITEDEDFYPWGGEIQFVNGDPNHYKFTGKERDIESGLDYFGKRYYGSALGRWTSPDPQGLALRHLLNPQKLNKYSYVLNNPMSAFDPDGMEEVTITYRAFIPAASVTVAGKTNGGDNRGFSTAANASSRTSISIKIETDPNIRPGNPIISVESHAGQSTTIKNGKVVETATATKGLSTATGTRVANGTPIINIQQDTKNPLSPGPSALTPGISANLNVMVYQDASATQVNGTAARFPAGELNETRADGTTTPVLQYMPPPGATPWSLALPDRHVDQKTATPACHGGDNGCPK